MNASAALSARRLLHASAFGIAWTAYLPVGAKYAVALLAAGAAIHARRDGSRSTAQPAWRPMLALLALLALSSLWSPAPWAEIASQLGLYGLLLLVPLLAPYLPAEAAQRAVTHFIGWSAVLALLFVLNAAQALPASPLWSHTVQAEGNQRICNSLLLAIAGALAVRRAVAAPPWRPRSAWCLIAALIIAGLALQDRRTGMVALPLLLLAAAVADARTPRRRLALGALVAVATVAAWLALGSVRDRFEEGWRELLADAPAENVATSWGQRLRMFELTAAMVAERPLAGHGIASWRTLWQQRVPPSSVIAANTTPHNEYLLIAQQAGLAGLAMLLWLWASMARESLRAGAGGVPALLVWVAMAWAGLFNAVLRDGKFALPLLLLAALTAAAARASVPDQPSR